MYVCLACGYVYDPEKGDPDSGIAPGTAFEDIPEDWVCDPDSGIAPGTAFEDIPEDWVCPLCGVGKDMFEKQ